MRKQSEKSFWIETGGATPRRAHAAAKAPTPKDVSFERPHALGLGLGLRLRLGLGLGLRLGLRLG